MSYYLVPLRLGLSDLLSRPRLALAMSLLMARFPFRRRAGMTAFDHDRPWQACVTGSQ